MKAILTIAVLCSVVLVSFGQAAKSTRLKKNVVPKNAKVITPQTAKATNNAPAVGATGLPAFITSEEVKFKGDALMLSGTLFLPKNKAGQKVPAVLMVADFYSNRDGIPVAPGRHNSYRELAEYFVSKGFAVLRYDRRCTGTSDCAPGTMALTADDGKMAVQYLQARKEIDPKKVLVFGHGDGSFIAAGIASHESVAGLIAVAALGRNASKLLREWGKQRMEDRKASAAETKEYLDKLETLILKLAEGARSSEDFSGDLNDELVAPLVKNPPYAFSWLLDDPLLIFPSVTGSVLVIHGAKDRRVPAKENSYLHDTLESGSHKDFKTLVLPDMDYFMKVNKNAPSVEVDNDTARALDPALLKALDEWIAQKIK